LLNTIYIVQFYSPAIILFFVYCKSMLQESDIVEVTNENFKKLKFKQIFDKFFFYHVLTITFRHSDAQSATRL